MKISLFFFQLISYTIVAFLQSIFMSETILLHRFVPDISFILFLFFAINNGPIGGTITGFIAGLLIHPFLLPDSVLGLYSFCYLFLGYLGGKLKGRFIVDPILLPLFYCVVAFLIRTFLLFLFSRMPDISIHLGHWIDLLIQAGMTFLLTPIVYNLCRWTKLVDLNRREKR